MLDFLGIGAQKAGTTWLFEMLKTHPDVHFPAGKEVHFWDEKYEKGISWYDDLFHTSSSGVNGEITPAYAILPLHKVAEIYEQYPNIKIIYGIRNPIDRAWSAALMHLERVGLASDYHTVSDDWFIHRFHGIGSIIRGDYEECLKRWYAYYDSKQFLIYRFEDIFNNPKQLLMRCCAHLGVNGSVFENSDPEMFKQKIFSGLGHPLRGSLRNVLREVYDEKIRSCESFLGVNLSEWLR